MAKTSLTSRDLTIHDAATRVGKTPETVRRWVWSGRLPARKEGNHLLVTEADLRRAAQSNQQPTLSDWLATLDLLETSEAAEQAISAADLILEDRRGRSTGDRRHARR